MQVKIFVVGFAADADPICEFCLVPMHTYMTISLATNTNIHTYSGDHGLSLLGHDRVRSGNSRGLSPNSAGLVQEALCGIVFQLPEQQYQVADELPNL